MHIDIRKDINRERTFHIEISTKNGLYTLVTKRKFDMHEDVKKERIRANPKETDDWKRVSE